MQLAMIDERILPVEELEPAYLDRGTYFGDGVYEVIRSYNGKIFALEEHLKRFANSLAAIEIIGVDIDEIRNKVTSLFEKAGITDAMIYFHITRGREPRNHKGGPNLKPSFFMTVTELPARSQSNADGIAVSTYPDLRWKRCDIKSLNLLPNILAMRDAAKKGCEEAILVNDAGFITEGAGSAFFAVFGKTLQVSPPGSNVLPSITKMFAISAGKNIGLELVEKAMTPDEALGADELFIAVTTRDIVPVVKFDGNIIGNGKPGRYTMELKEEFQKFTR